MTSPSIIVQTAGGHDFNLPAELAGLGDLAYNLWWTWNPRAQSLFSRINPSAWARHRNSIAVLRYSDHARWADLTADEDFMVDASRVLDEFANYMRNGEDSWYRSRPETTSSSGTSWRRPCGSGSRLPAWRPMSSSSSAEAPPTSRMRRST